MVKSHLLNQFSLTLVLAFVAALLLALQFDLAPTVVQANSETVQDGDTTTIRTILPYSETDRDTSCTSGPTGNCRVTFTRMYLSEEHSQSECNASQCMYRTEIRW